MRSAIFIIIFFFVAPLQAQDVPDIQSSVESNAGVGGEETLTSQNRVRRSKLGYTESKPIFGGPTSTEGDLEEADEELTPAFRFPAIDKFFTPWADWKRRQNDDHGIQVSAHYSSMYQQLSDALPGTDDKASGGVFRGTIKWTLFGKDTPNWGSLNLMVDNRQSYRNTSPADLAASAGYIGITGLFYNDMGTAIINLNWQQSLNEGNTGLIVGRYDPNDYMNVLGYVNPWTIFSNLTINLDNSIVLPDSSWGIGLGHWFNDQVYVIGGINDANGVGSDNLEFFKGGSEFFTYGHLGWSPSKDERYFKNIHIMTWHVDERVDAGVPSGKGVAIAANWTFNDVWMPFARLGYSEGAAAIYNESASIGVIRKFQYRSDLVGISANWGSSPDESLKDQTTVEAFWRIQAAQNFAITPSIQLLMDPALNTEQDKVWVYGLRMRLSF